MAVDFVGEMCCVVVVCDLAFDSLSWSNNCHSSSDIFSGLVEKDLEAMETGKGERLWLRSERERVDFCRVENSLRE